MLSLIGVYTCELSKRRSQSVTPFYVLKGLTLFCLDSFDLGYIGPQPKKLWIPWSYLSEGCWAESTCGGTTEACATHLIAGQRQATPSCLCARHVKSHPWHGCSILTLILSNPMAFPLKWTSSASNSWRFNFSPSRDCCELDTALKQPSGESGKFNIYSHHNKSWRPTGHRTGNANLQNNDRCENCWNASSIVTVRLLSTLSSLRRYETEIHSHKLSNLSNKPKKTQI